MTTPPNEISVEIVTNEKTGLMVDFSDDLTGLYAHGRTLEELETNTLTAIADIVGEIIGKK